MLVAADNTVDVALTKPNSNGANTPSPPPPPPPPSQGMSFNRSMWLLTGRQIGREARAMMNAGNGYSTFWAPVINLAREVCVRVCVCVLCVVWYCRG